MSTIPIHMSVSSTNVEIPFKASTTYYMSFIKVDTIRNWSQVESLITPKKGEIIVYSDRNVVNGVNYPGVKIGDGVSELGDLPFLNDDIANRIISSLELHIQDTDLHVTNEERTYWNGSVRPEDITSKADLSIFASLFSSESTYEAGDHVIYNGEYYVCTEDVSEPGQWNSNNWEKTTVGNEASSIKEEMSQATFAPGGSTGDILSKRSDSDFEVEWITPANEPEQDNTRPITSAAVYTEIDKIYQNLANKADASDVPELTSLIDDTAGSGNTNVTWSANKIYQDINSKTDKITPVISASIGNILTLSSDGGIQNSGTKLSDLKIVRVKLTFGNNSSSQQTGIIRTVEWSGGVAFTNSARVIGYNFTDEQHIIVVDYTIEERKVRGVATLMPGATGAAIELYIADTRTTN